MRDRLDAEGAFRDYTGRERYRKGIFQAMMGDGGGNLGVPDRPGWIYIRLHGGSVSP